MASIATNKYKVVAVLDKCGIEKTQEKEQRQRRHLSPDAFSIREKKDETYSALGQWGVLLVGLKC